MAQKAPGKHYRKGLSILEVINMFPDDETAEQWFIKTRWADGIRCPHCNSDNVLVKSAHATMPHRCRSCRKHFSVKTGTAMQGSNLGYRIWAIAIYLFTTNLKSVSSMKLHRDLAITQKSAWHLAHRIRESYNANALDMFSGPAEADETYMGGKRRNMSNSKRKTLTGRGAVGKTAVAGIKDRETNQVVAKVVESTDKPTLQGFIKDTVEPGSELYTDEHGAYEGIEGYEHDSVKHSSSQYVKGVVHTNGVESFWSMFKRAHKGTFHKMSPKHLQRYVNEFSGRHNHREGNTIDQMVNVADKMNRKRLTYKRLIADNGLDSGARGG